MALLAEYVKSDEPEKGVAELSMPLFQHEMARVEVVDTPIRGGDEFTVMQNRGKTNFRPVACQLGSPWCE